MLPTIRSPAATLIETVERAAAVFRPMGETEVAAKPDAKRWSKEEILGHLIDSACNSHQRFVRAQLEGELRFPGYEQEGWARIQGYADAEWSLLVDLWELYNRHLAFVIALIPPQHMEIQCTIGDKPPVSLGFLIDDYIVHMNHHLRQLER